MVDLDSEAFRPLKFEWSNSELVVVEEDSLTTTGRVAKAVFRGNHQEWSFQDTKMKKDG